MAQSVEDTSSLESTTLSIFRTSATVRGGRRFSFGALVVVGDRHARIGLGYAKAPSVPAAVEKAQKTAKKQVRRVAVQDATIPHAVIGRFETAEVKMLPASPGTGVIAGGTVRGILEMAGVRDCLTKSYGSTNAKNLAKAVLNGLESLRSKEWIEQLRGVRIEPTRVERMVESGHAAAAGEEGDKAGGRGGTAVAAETSGESSEGEGSEVPGAGEATDTGQTSATEGTAGESGPSGSDASQGSSSEGGGSGEQQGG